MKVENGKIVLPDGLTYSVLVLPDQDYIPLDVLQKLETMVLEGATIIGRKPLGVPYLNNYGEDNAELSELVNKMWGKIDGKDRMINEYGKGRVIYGSSPRNVLTTDGIYPDFYHDGNSALDYIHRQDGNTDIYFIRNKTDEQYSGSCSFRVSDKYPAIWDPSTGEMFCVDEYADSNGKISLNLDLEPNASLFLVFSREEGSDEGKLFQTNTWDKVTTIDGSWRVTFPEGWGAPAEANFDKLISWTDSDNEGIKYFSGTASYHKTISIASEDIEGSRIDLDLGYVADVAEVFLNGKSAGILWKEPFKIDLTELVRSGENELIIEVVNQWVNRLSGDMLLDPDDRFCRTNHPYITSDDMGNDNWVGNSDETFRPKTSGLLGPVQIKIQKRQ